MPMMYRSPWTQWFLTGAALMAGAVTTFGNQIKWRSTPSLQWLAHSHIPLRAWGVALMVYGLLLIWPRSRPLGFVIGAVLFTIFTVSLFATVSLWDDEPKNAIVLAAMVDTVVFHLYSVRIAWNVRLLG